MARQVFGVDDVLEAVFNDDFGLSDGESSAGEEGEDVYAYLGDPVLDRGQIRDLTSRLTIGSDIDDDNTQILEAEATNDDETSKEEEEDMNLVQGGTETDEDGQESDNSDEDFFAASSRASGSDMSQDLRMVMPLIARGRGWVIVLAISPQEAGVEGGVAMLEEHVVVDVDVVVVDV